MGEFDENLFPPEMYNSQFPTIDLHENNNEVHVKIDLPGMNKEDIDIKVDDGLLTIEGERKSEINETGSRYTYSERKFGSFKRTVSLPRTTDTSKISASYDNGVLHVHAPKSETIRTSPHIPIR
jgi:HSP20 family protein